jgi:hypothetical protein
LLTKYHIEQKAKYKAAESSKAKALEPGTFVSLRVASPSKGEAKWQPGFVVIESCDSALRIRSLETRKEYRINQKDVRVIPEALPYEEVDPLPSTRRDAKTNDLPLKALPLACPDEPTLLTPPGLSKIESSCGVVGC